MRRRALQSSRALQSWSAGRDEVKLRFQCTGCGKCCTGRGGRVRVNQRELQELATATNLSVPEFVQNYTRAIEEDVDGHKRTHLVLKQTSDDKQCIFLKGSKCSVYQARPTQCRTFPWWPQNLVSDYDWQVAAADCEGIHVTQEDKQEDIPAYSFDDVLPETILHDIHRSGEDYTYDELKQMLHDLREVDPEFVEQYKAEFVATFSREIVHSDDKVTVLDSFIEGEGKPTRSFVFNDRLHLTQSEVALSVKSGDSALSFDRSSLALDVHRALCMPLAWLQSDQQLTPLRVAVLGAGACSLPLFLLEQHSPEKLGHLDAIEPSSEVNDIARRFFGVGTALSRDARFVLHEKMGEDFLSEQSEDAAFDLLILDVEAGEGHDGVNAPPLSMLESSFLFTAKRLLAGHGILAINVITESEDALRNVETHLGQAFSRGLQLSLPSNSVYFLLNDNGAESPYDVGEYIQQLKESTFQTQYACTTQLLEKNRLTMWLRKER